MPTQLASGSLPVASPRTDSTRDVGREQEEARRDELLRAPLGRMRSHAPAGEEPEDDEARDRLDQAVGAEPDERDRARRDPGADRDGELDDVVRDPAPREQPRPPLEPRPLDAPAASGAICIRPPAMPQL